MAPKKMSDMGYTNEQEEDPEVPVASEVHEEDDETDDDEVATLTELLAQQDFMGTVAQCSTATLQEMLPELKTFVDEQKQKLKDMTDHLNQRSSEERKATSKALTKAKAKAKSMAKEADKAVLINITVVFRGRSVLLSVPRYSTIGSVRAMAVMQLNLLIENKADKIKNKVAKKMGMWVNGVALHDSARATFYEKGFRTDIAIQMNYPDEDDDEQDEEEETE